MLSAGEDNIMSVWMDRHGVEIKHHSGFRREKLSWIFVECRAYLGECRAHFLNECACDGCSHNAFSTGASVPHSLLLTLLELIPSSTSEKNALLSEVSWV